MTTAIAISPATERDIPALCGLLAVLFSQEAEFSPNRDAQQQGLAEIIGNPDIGTILVARSGDTVVGMVGLLYTVSTALGGRVAWLEGMVVAPDCRDAGIGTMLLTHAVETARKNGCRRITLLTDRSNLSARRFYRRHRFIESPMLPLRLMLDD